MSDRVIAIIGGCGHVGLPLGLAFARAGATVVAIDTDVEKVKRVGGGSMPFMDKGADELLPEVLASGRFRCSTDPSDVTQADTVIAVVGTPVDSYMNPRFALMADMLKAYVSHLRSDQLFVLRSTVYPGTTGQVRDLLSRRGLDMDVAFCPERVAEGRALEEISGLPQIVAGCTRRAHSRAVKLFRMLTDDIVELEPIAAELSKLFTNAWRYAQFALANQFFMIANDHGVDFYEIHRAMTFKYPRAQWFAKAGFAAGPCLFKDTVQLHAFQNNTFFMGQAAIFINEGLPNYVVQRMKKRFSLEKMVVGILGMTFKADNDDTRDSLAFKLRKLLSVECREVLCSDPYVREPWVVPVQDVLSTADVIVIGVPHQEYASLTFGKVPVVDVWNVTEERVRTL